MSSCSFEALVFIWGSAEHETNVEGSLCFGTECSVWCSNNINQQGLVPLRGKWFLSDLWTYVRHGVCIEKTSYLSHKPEAMQWKFFSFARYTSILCSTINPNHNKSLLYPKPILLLCCCSSFNPQWEGMEIESLRYFNFYCQTHSVIKFWTRPMKSLVCTSWVGRFSSHHDSSLPRWSQNHTSRTTIWQPRCPHEPQCSEQGLF